MAGAKILKLISSILFLGIFGYTSRVIPKFPGIFWLNGADYAIKQLPKFLGNFPNKFLCKG